MWRNHPVGLPGVASFAIGLLFFLVALLAARRRAGAEARGNATRSRRSMLGILVQGVGIVLAGFGPIDVTLDPLGATAMAEAAAVALLMAGTVGLFAWASRTMGRNWSIVARTRDDHRLVETGPFAIVRHPIYVALFLLMLAMAIAYGHVSHLIGAIPLYAIGTWLRIGEEERLLGALFGGAYDDYARRVRRFVPGVF
ncbi:isoprenylcysteine carboxylmethyltransferase family protein [Sphingomonas bacterium]|uniref:methyltransferase family protein n=1 Tax=Sphingomonas bacterium TaxID=1895847 RepID=UPI001575B3B4|nr:isoprenylcysteine carboxylmethyltransferase family protein [Sphingomonas bacterium]